jgi:hypothetical protein
VQRLRQYTLVLTCHVNQLLDVNAVVVGSCGVCLAALSNRYKQHNQQQQQQLHSCSVEASKPHAHSSWHCLVINLRLDFRAFMSDLSLFCFSAMLLRATAYQLVSLHLCTNETTNTLLQLLLTADISEPSDHCCCYYCMATLPVSAAAAAAAAAVVL